MIDVRSQPTLGDYLVREGIISQSQLNRALEEQNATSRSIGRNLVDLGFITENTRMTILQKRFGFELLRLKDVKSDPMLFAMIPYSFAEKHRVVPIRQDEEHTLIVAMEDPSDILIVDAIKNQIGMRIKPVVASHEDIQNVLDQYQTHSDAKALPAGAALEARLAYKILKNTAFPVLALAPLVFFFVALSFDIADTAKMLRHALQEEIITRWDLSLYIGLIWGLWTIILFEINGLIFGRDNHEEE